MVAFAETAAKKKKKSKFQVIKTFYIGQISIQLIFILRIWFHIFIKLCKIQKDKLVTTTSELDNTKRQKRAQESV